MNSGVPKKYHGDTLRVPWGHQAEAGWVFPWEPTHCWILVWVGFGLALDSVRVGSELGLGWV